MAVSVSRAGPIVTITVTVDVTGMSLGSYTASQRRLIVAGAAAAQLADAARLNDRADAEVDAEYAARVAALQAERDALKAARPSGSA